MPLIPAQPTIDKETLSLRLERTLHERLKQYATFIQSPKDYVIGQALRRLFEKDHEFAAWLRAHAGAAALAGNETSSDHADEETPVPQGRPVLPVSRTRTEREA